MPIRSGGKEMKLSISLSEKSINHAIGELKRYRDSLPSKNALFVTRLLEAGIKEAESYKGFYGNYIIFEKDVREGRKTCVGVLTGKNSGEVISYWNKNGKIKKAAISPILFAEFGSGPMAEVLFEDAPANVGQGTFPGQTHAFDPNGWWYMGLNGVWYHNKGFKPSHPMYHAELEMWDKIYTIAREVYYSGE